MDKRLQRLGIGLVFLGIVFFAAGGYTLYKTQQGAASLQAFSAAQDVKLNYNDQGQLVDRGTTEGSAAIMSLLVNDWGYAVDQGELNPNDPLVNTASEYMYQMATISYHTLHGETTVTIPEDVVVDGQLVTAAGTYEFVNDGRYWTGFDRTDPIQGAAREQIWTGTAHGLIAELGVGTVTASALTMGLGIAALFALVGLTVVVAGLGLVWATRGATEKVKAPAFKQVANPA
ncbi:MAG TPA: hypothetical protein VD763_02070 [Candidatus Saccharimonadales bacterium]|nr:hypothetical protein [Candidatus Saccharimonadales bacterium]